MSDSTETGRIYINQINISYTFDGPVEAPVIIFIHGFPLNKSMWKQQVAALEATYCIITYDVRGHGFTDEGTVDYTIKLFVSDLLSLMDALGIDRATICGLSMGGYIALNAITHYPERFDALVLCDTTCKADTQEGIAKRMNAIETIANDGVETYTSNSIGNLFAPASIDKNIRAVEEVRAMIRNTSVTSITRTLHALAGRSETCSVLSSIRVTVLIVVGSEDKLTPPASAQSMHESIHGSRLDIIEAAGHLSNLEQPDVFNACLIKFLAAVYQKGS